MGEPLVALSALPAHGHVYPLIPLAQALQRAGARVQVTTGAEFVGRLPVPTAAGCDIAMWGAAMQTAQRWPEAAGTADGRAEFNNVSHTTWLPAHFGVTLGEATYRPLLELWRDERPDLVIYESLASGAAVAADDLDVPTAMFGISAMRPTTDMSAVLHRYHEQPDLQPWAQLPEPDAAPHTLIDPFPTALRAESLTDIADLLPVRPVAFEEENPTFALTRTRTDAPLVYVTLGTAANNPEALRGAVSEAAEVGEVAVAVGPGRDLSQLGDFGPGVHVFDFVPQASVLEQADLVVHHGGSGTTLAAAAAGVPQLVLPQGADQFFNAAGVARAGVGLPLFPDARREGDVREALTRLREEPSIAESVDALAVQIETLPNPDEVAATLLTRLD